MTEKETSEENKSKETKHNTKDDRKRWWNTDLKFSLIFFALGVIMGFVGYVINVPLKSGIIALVVFIGAALLFQKTQNLKEGKGWWFSKFIVYIFFWFMAWTVFHTSCSIYNTLCL
ncbi:MAG: hypothetical protein HZB65_00535 [Candidatus Aenigmarchaeota archaeon]|nr:hypothetical protein [Candidatus Aenigmarchaeota archaeon]